MIIRATTHELNKPTTTPFHALLCMQPATGMQCGCQPQTPPTVRKVAPGTSDTCHAGVALAYIQTQAEHG